MPRQKRSWIIIGFLLCAPILFLIGFRVYKNITFKIDCADHLKRTADANTIKLATQEMNTVIHYLEENNLTQGYTSIAIKTPDEDIEFWYTNLKQALDELQRVKPDATQLEKSNILMKLRETILDNNIITLPRGISVSPHNKLLALAAILSLILMIVGLFLLSTNIRKKPSLSEIMIIAAIIGIVLAVILPTCQ